MSSAISRLDDGDISSLPEERLVAVRALAARWTEEAGDEDVFRKIREDFDTNSVDQSDHQIRRTMDELMAQAMTEVGKQA